MNNIKYLLGQGVHVCLQTSQDIVFQLCLLVFLHGNFEQFECEKAGNTKITSHVLWYLDLVVLFQWGLKSSICHQLII